MVQVRIAGGLTGGRQHCLVDIRITLRSLDRLQQTVDFWRWMADLASKNVDDGDALTVETLVLVGALDDNRTIDLDTSIKPTTLHVIPDGRLTLVHLGFENPTYTNGTGGSTDLATNRTTEGFESLERLGGIDHNNTVVDIDASQEPDTSRMQHDTRRGTPIAGCGFAAKQHSGATGTAEP